MALIPDPMADLADIVGQVEDLLLFCDADGDDEVAVFDAGARAAGGLTIALREAAASAPNLIAPDGRTELGPMLLCPSTFRWIRLILAAVESLPVEDLRSRAPAALIALHLIYRCLPHDPGPAGVERDKAVRDECRRRPQDNIVVPSTPWEDEVNAEQEVLLAAWPEGSTVRWILTTEQHRAYSRLLTMVLDDPLERFVMG
ncbi:MAG: hypothetical protein ACRD0E_00630 [Acidimicrobiales bacterium]